MQNQLSKEQSFFTAEEQKTINRWLRTDTGAKLLQAIKEFEQAHLDCAKLALSANKGNDYIANKVAAAEATAQIYEWLKPPEKEPDGEEQ